MSFCIEVVRSGGAPVTGVRVRFEFTSVIRGMSGVEYTDSAGQAWFDEDYDDGSIRVFVSGDDVGEYYYEDGDSVTVSIG
jgi:hypothetical protein